MQLFILTAHCTTEVNCGTCRNRDGGRKTREWWATRYELPGGIDFECPAERGAKPWGFQPPSKGLGDTVKKVIDKVSMALTGKAPKPCGGCAGRQAALNKLLPYKTSEQ